MTPRKPKKAKAEIWWGVESDGELFLLRKDRKSAREMAAYNRRTFGYNVRTIRVEVREVEK